MNYPNTPGYKTGGTSEAAALSMVDVAPTLRDRVYTHIKSRGACGSSADECAKAIDETVLAVRPRFSELKELGDIRETKLTTLNESGRAASIYVASVYYAR